MFLSLLCIVLAIEWSCLIGNCWTPRNFCLIFYLIRDVSSLHKDNHDYRRLSTTVLEWRGSERSMYDYDTWQKVNLKMKNVKKFFERKYLFGHTSFVSNLLTKQLTWTAFLKNLRTFKNIVHRGTQEKMTFIILGLDLCLNNCLQNGF